EQGEASRLVPATSPGRWVVVSPLTRRPPPDKREQSAVDPGAWRPPPLPHFPALSSPSEANELMEDLFDIVNEMGFSNMEDDGPEEEGRVAEPRPNFNTSEALRFEKPLASLLNEQHQTVKELFEQLKMKKSSAKEQPEVEKVKLQCKEVYQTLILDPAQRKRLQQQMQQVILFLVMLMLDYTTLYLNAKMHLQAFMKPSFALETDLSEIYFLIANEFPCLPEQVAWILATSKVFMYPELLPVCSLKAKNLQGKILFTKAEDNTYLLTCKTARQLTVRIKNLNLNRAPDNIIKFYKKTKQLPVLLKCCEEIQPHQWKPPIEREEHRLPFWLKASLPSIQEELRHMADGAREVGNVTGTTEIGSDRGLEKDNSELGSETRYPLLLPKGVVLKLKPVANRFPRKAWRQRRSSVLKPLLIQPSPSLQPSFNPGKTPARSTHSEAPPSNVVVRIPHLIQPATVLQTVPGVPPLGASGGDGFECPAALPALPPEARTSFPLSESQTLLSSAPVPKVMLPSLAPSKFRKPYVRRRPSKRRGAKASPCMKPAPVIHPAPVIFTVPATTVKIVSLGSGCNMIQPVNAAVAQSPQTIPITTLLVNPTSFPCPLNQPLVASSVSPLIVSGNSVNLPIPSASEDKAQVNVDIACAVADGKNAFQGLEPKFEPQEVSPLCAAVFPKVEHSSGLPPADTECQEGLSENSAYRWTVVKTEEGRHTLEPLPQGIQESLNNSAPGVSEEIVKMEEIIGFP
uniref:YY1 associated protein 1 n=1 Tax=Saimiri boliviensis boliviensis TaxID=39432 RepID=A0A2K6U2F6_SAIBB